HTTRLPPALLSHAPAAPPFRLPQLARAPCPELGATQHGDARASSRACFYRRRPATRGVGTRSVSARELGRARDIRYVRSQVHRAPGPDPDPDARRLGRVPAAPRLPRGRRGRRVLRRARDLANGSGEGMSTPEGVTISRTGETGAFGGELLSVNFGPHHPSTHGVLRLIVDLDGEQVRSVKPVIGYLHTGIEKQMEALRWQQGVVVTDRHDYLSPPINNLAYALAVERLMGVEVPPRAQALRVIMSELTRLSSHLVWLGTSGIELGAMSVLMYCFRERDTIMDMNEEISGFRLHTSYIRPGG